MRALAAIAGAAVIATAPTAAGALETSLPVRLGGCGAAAPDPTPITAYNPNPWGGGDAQITFTNTSPVTATHVVMLLRYNGMEQRVDISGTFSPGIRIDRDEPIVPFISALDLTCRVTEIDFRDGTTWHAPAPASRRAR